MGKRGPRPAPTSLKLLQGQRSDRINTDEPVPSELPIAPPAGMSAEALEVWHELAPDLIAKKVLTAWDVHAFRTWCDAVATMTAARAVLDAEGAVVEAQVFDRNGKPTGTRTVKSPWFYVWKDAADVAGRYGARFGLTPSDRSQVRSDDGQPDNGDPARLLS